jgi:hypothetical protein
MPAVRMPAVRMPAVRMPAVRMPAVRMPAVRMPVPVCPVNVPETCPAAIVAVAGVVAMSTSFEVKITVAPAGPAGPARVRVPVEVPPATIVVGLSERFVSAAGVTVTTAVCGTLAYVPVIVAATDADTGIVVTV